MAEILLENSRNRRGFASTLGPLRGWQDLSHAERRSHPAPAGVDLVIGLVETMAQGYAGPDTRPGIVPQRVIPYRGVNLKEMDVDAIMARHPRPWCGRAGAYQRARKQEPQAIRGCAELLEAAST